MLLKRTNLGVIYYAYKLQHEYSVLNSKIFNNYTMSHKILFFI